MIKSVSATGFFSTRPTATDPCFDYSTFVYSCIKSYSLSCLLKVKHVVTTWQIIFVQRARIYKVYKLYIPPLVLKTHLTDERIGDQSCGCPACPKWQSYDFESEPRSPDALSTVLSSPQLPLCYAKAQKSCTDWEHENSKSMKGYAVKEWTVVVKTVNRASEQKNKALCLMRPKLARCWETKWAIDCVKNNLV